MCFDLILTSSKEEVEDVHVEVADLQDEFKNIVSDNVPDGFQPMRKIIHHMGLIP